MRIEEEPENADQTHEAASEGEEEAEEEVEENGSEGSDHLTVLTTKLMDEILGEKAPSTKLTFDIPYQIKEQETSDKRLLESEQKKLNQKLKEVDAKFNNN